MKQQKKLGFQFIFSFLILIFFLGSATLIGLFFQTQNISETNIVIIYLLFVLLTARLTEGFVYGIFAAFSSTLAFNYFFTEPRYSLQVNNSGYFITFFIMTSIAVITSALTSKIKKSANIALEKEREMRALYFLTNQLTDATDYEGIAETIVRTLSDILQERVACLCFDENGNPQNSFVQCVSKEHVIYRETQNVNDIRYRIAELRTAYFEGEEFCDWPIYGRESVLGVIRIPKSCNMNLTESQKKIIHSMIESTALAMDRLREEKARHKSNQEIMQERFRATFLRSISHDLRTPLSGIMGTAEILMDQTKDNNETYEMISAIYKDADWLHSMVENILNITKIQEGKLVPRKQYEALEEIIESALEHFKRRELEHRIILDIPEQVIIIQMDGKLMMQVFINLLDNAMKHSEKDSEIIVRVMLVPETDQVEISILDSGEGIFDEDIPHIFQMFYASKNLKKEEKHGVGLGLSICQAIVLAHNGTIYAENRKDMAGAVFRILLPLH